METISEAMTYNEQAVEVKHLNRNNKTIHTFYTIAPIDDSRRCVFIEALTNEDNRQTFRYKLKDSDDETGIYHVQVVYYDHMSNMIFTRRE